VQEGEGGVMIARGSHGEARAGNWSAEYSIWHGIVQRCTNPNSKTFPDYGGRGVTICDLWRMSYAEFIAHIGRRPTPGHSVDRIDNSRGYEPGNVRWASKLRG
jgi:hypothetical protein